MALSYDEALLLAFRAELDEKALSRTPFAKPPTIPREAEAPTDEEEEMKHHRARAAAAVGFVAVAQSSVHRISRGKEQVLRVLRLRRKWVAAIVGVAVIGTSAAVALGSGSLFFTSTPLVTANLDNTVQLNSDRIKLQTKDPTVTRVATVVFGAGGSSGWHHHPGFVIVSVKSGSVTVWNSDCSQTTYGAGSAFVESGDDPAQVTSVGGATNYVTSVVPNVSPLVFRIEDPVPACAG